MNNDPELSQQGKYLGTITSDFIKVSSTLKEASYQLRVRKISEYPIFVLCKEEQPIGKSLHIQNNAETIWEYSFALFEEFVQRGIIAEDKIDDFKKAFKNPDEFCCLFVVDKDFTNFVFLPYPVDED